MESFNPSSRRSAEAIAEGFGSWFDGCQYVYLDVGTNIGIQIRKVFEPELFPEAKVLPIFDEIIGTNRSSRHDLCVVGFEPNIHHTTRLQELETAYLRRGWRVKIFTETAVALKNGEADFFFDTVAPAQRHQWGASLIPYHETMRDDQGSSDGGKRTAAAKATVHTMDLADYIVRYVAARHHDTGRNHQILMKLDIEGAEHELLPHLILT